MCGICSFLLIYSEVDIKYLSKSPRQQPGKSQHTRVTSWVMKAVVSTCVEIMLLTGKLRHQQEPLSCHT